MTTTDTMDPRIREVAFNFNLRTGAGFTSNQWNGADLTGTSIRLTSDDGVITLFVFEDSRRWVPEYEITFLGSVPVSVIDAVVRSI